MLGQPATIDLLGREHCSEKASMVFESVKPIKQGERKFINDAWMTASDYFCRSRIINKPELFQEGRKLMRFHRPYVAEQAPDTKVGLLAKVVFTREQNTWLVLVRENLRKPWDPRFAPRLGQSNLHMTWAFYFGQRDEKKSHSFIGTRTRVFRNTPPVKQPPSPLPKTWSKSQHLATKPQLIAQWGLKCKLKFLWAFCYDKKLEWIANVFRPSKHQTKTFHQGTLLMTGHNIFIARLIKPAVITHA